MRAIDVDKGEGVDHEEDAGAGVKRDLGRTVINVGGLRAKVPPLPENMPESGGGKEENENP